MSSKFLFVIALYCTCFAAASQSSADITSMPKVKWKFKTGAVFGSPVADGKTVFVTSANKALHVLDAQTGKEKWKFDTYGAMRSTPLVHENYVYIISEDGTLYKLNKETGSIVWQFVTPQGTLQERKYDRADYFQSSPIFYDGKIYFGMGDYLYSVDSEKGTTRWNFKTGNVVHSKPVVANGKVLFGSYDGYFYAVDASIGTLIWKFKSVGQRYFPNGEMMGNPVVLGNTVYVGSRDYNFYALNINSGYCHWNKQFPKGWALAATIHKDSILYLGTSDDYVMLALDPGTGTEKWRSVLKYNIFGAMTVGNSVGYVGTLMGKLFGVDLQSGKMLWTFETDAYKTNKSVYFDSSDAHLQSALQKFSDFDEVIKMYHAMGAIFSSPAITENGVVFAGADGLVYCLGI